MTVARLRNNPVFQNQPGIATLRTSRGDVVRVLIDLFDSNREVVLSARQC